MSSIQLEFELGADQCPQCEPLLEEAGAVSISYLDPGGEPVLEPAPGTSPLWTRVRLVALFSEPPAESLYADLCAALGVETLAGWQFERLDARCWERAWMDHYHPMRFGERLWVCPTHLAPPEPDAINLRLDPGLAFGTGTHPTTALCLSWLDGLDLRDKTVVDYGCGSGILGIAALLLGARSCVGVDNDPQALEASLENAQRNDVAERLRVCLPEQADDVHGEILIANILSGVLIELAPRLVMALPPGGRIALSGILERQADDVEAAFSAWIDWEPLRAHEGWVLLHGRRRG